MACKVTFKVCSTEYSLFMASGIHAHRMSFLIVRRHFDHSGYKGLDIAKREHKSDVLFQAITSSRPTPSINF